ncbi:hypothetical protein ES332_A08G097800v1 [Gossypium tomentosum]|uniref:Pentacotripeptide-repeat region of PRORP domain-containing protein n=1 Tax=Gossypium tomentosum TaxID=34277 RepID=A0A5D2PCB8_GOSTO|nr:hypothetical protein ES332_A08G097800v1 [Gossypium tomentosum]
MSDNVSNQADALSSHRLSQSFGPFCGRIFVEKNENATALSLYKNMLQTGFLPNNYTFSFVLRACTDKSPVGLASHAQVIKMGWESYDLYANRSSMEAARKLFDVSTCRDVITWTALINGYVKFGQVEFARELFDQMPERNEVSWSAMITGYVHMGMFREALELFNDMQLTGLRPNHAGIVGALTACSYLGSLDHGRWIHAYVDRNGMELDRVLGIALVDMYAKCGCIEIACSVFEKMPDKDVFAFTSLISGLANHGQSADAIQFACSRMGLVDEGLRIFNCMSVVYGIEPGVQHYGCMVDLLGRAGLLEEAKRLVREMPMEPDSYVLGALLNSCRVHGDVELGKETVESLVERGLDHGGVHVLLSNMYASSNQWDWVVKVRKEMGAKKVRKVPGCSSIEIDGSVSEFIAGDMSYLRVEDVMLVLLGIDNHLKCLFLADDNTNSNMIAY